MSTRILHVIANADIDAPAASHAPGRTWLTELDHAWRVLEAAGFEQLLVSPAGGAVAVGHTDDRAHGHADGHLGAADADDAADTDADDVAGVASVAGSVAGAEASAGASGDPAADFSTDAAADADASAWTTDPIRSALLARTAAPAQIDAGDFDALVCVATGAGSTATAAAAAAHDSPGLERIARSIASHGGIVAAIGHADCALTASADAARAITGADAHVLADGHAGTATAERIAALLAGS